MNLKNLHQNLWKNNNNNNYYQLKLVFLLKSNLTPKFKNRMKIKLTYHLMNSKRNLKIQQILLELSNKKMLKPKKLVTILQLMTIVRYMKQPMMSKAMNYHKKQNLKLRIIKNNSIKVLKMIKIILQNQSNQKVKIKILNNNKKLNKHLMFQIKNNRKSIKIKQI